jgi:diguanylate cyclase (GGDEF)-like protein
MFLFFTFRRNRGTFDRATWTGLWAFAGGLMALLWGLASYPMYHHGQAAIRLAVVGLQSAFIYGSASRNASCPVVAYVQILLTSAVIITMYLGLHQAAATDFALVVLVNVAPTFAIVRQLHRQIIRALISDEEKSRLVAVVEFTHAELLATNARMMTIASTDELTAIANRRRLDAVFEAEARRAERSMSSLAILVVDIDWFKRYNDTFGHPRGDGCLHDVAQGLARSLRRSTDLIGRYGGEEFVAILPETDAAEAREVAERARMAIEDLEIPHPASDFGRVTVSIGVATSGDGTSRRPSELIGIADQSLYLAKRTGRNRVCVGSGEHARNAVVEARPATG